MTWTPTVLGVAPAPGPRTLTQLFRPQARNMLLGAFWLLATNICALAIPRLVNMAIDDVEGRPNTWPL